MGFADGFVQGLKLRSLMNQQKEENQLKQLIQPFISAAMTDTKDTVVANPSYDLLASVMNKKNSRDIVNTDFSPQNNTSNASMNPLLYKKGLAANSPEFVQKHALALTMAGVKPNALPWGMRTGDENRAAALIDGDLAMSAKDKAAEERLRNFGLLTQGRDGSESNVKYGTGSQITPNLITAAKNLGISGYNFDMPATTGYEVDKASSRIAADKALIEQRNSATWRNMNKPLSGTGKTKSGKAVTPSSQFNTDQDWQAASQYIANAPTKEEYIQRLNTYSKTLESFADNGYDVENFITYLNDRWGLSDNSSSSAAALK